MVQKSKGGKKSGSVISSKRKKNEMKYKRKNNYKKEKEKKIECCVCYEEIKDCSDNVVTCGKINHGLCGECKLKCKDCPMCRSHSVKLPINQIVDIPILKKIKGKQKKITVQGWTSPERNGDYYLYSKTKYNYPVYKNEHNYFIYYDLRKSSHYYSTWILNDNFDTSPKTFYAEVEGSLVGRKVWSYGAELDSYKVIVISK
jgi:hypothetical protein